MENKNEEYYLKYLIGNNYESFKRGGFSFAYFFFGEYYLLYRKMYLIFAIKYLLSITIKLGVLYAYAASDNNAVLIAFGIYILSNLLPDLFIKKYYYNYSYNKVIKILDECKNKSEKEIIRICESLGGTNILLPIVLFVFFMFIGNFKTDIASLKTIDINVRELKTKLTEYVSAQDTSYENFTIMKGSTCIVSINTRRSLDQFESYNRLDDSMYNVKTINNNEWDHFYDSNVDYYYIKHNDFYYEVRTMSINDDKCSKSIDILVENLSFE